MKISIVTVVYNNKETIQDAMSSVLSQDYKNIEYIVVDGASTDGTVETIQDIIRKFPERDIKLVSEKDDGIYDAMNKGISLATGEVVGTLNSDDVYADNFAIRKVANLFETNLTDSCYADLVYVDSDNFNKVIRYWKSCDCEEDLFGKGWIPPHPTFFVRRDVYHKYGLFDLSYKLAADFELMVRFLARHKISSKYIPEVLVKMRLGGVTNRSKINIVKQNIEIYRAMKKNRLHVLPFYFALYKIFNRAKQFVSRPGENIL